MRIADILDIAVISVFLYFCILWVRQRSSRSVIAGVSIIAALYIAARMLNMHLTSLLFQVGFTALMVAFVVVFQMDIRRAFERLATRRMFRHQQSTSKDTQPIEVLVEAVFNMAQNRTGALIVIKGSEPLELHTRAGVALDGLINMPLLLSIFSTHSPGHDGAVLIEKNRIKGFGIYLPLSTKSTRITIGGTRHAAAMGLAERSDALVIVVSEERGAVSIAHQGQLYPLRSKEQLTKALTDFYSTTLSYEPARRFRFLTENPGTKVASLVVALVLWFALAYRTETITRGFEVPVGYRNVPPDWAIEEVTPEKVRVTLSGIQRQFDYDHSNMMVLLNLSNLVEGMQSVQIVESDVVKPAGPSLKQITPGAVTISAYRTTRIKLPVKFESIGTIAQGLELIGTHITPDSLTIRIRKAVKDSVSSLSTFPVNLGGVLRDTTIIAGVVLPPYSFSQGETPLRVRVFINVEKKNVK